MALTDLEVNEEEVREIIRMNEERAEEHGKLHRDLAEADYLQTNAEGRSAEKRRVSREDEARLRAGAPEASLNLKWLAEELKRLNYGNKRFIETLMLAQVEGGFRMENNLEWRTVIGKNGRSAYLHPEKVHGKIREMRSKGYALGPFKREELPFEHVRVSGIFLIPRKSKGKWRLIVHMSAPEGDSVNSNRDMNVPIKFHTIDYAAERVSRLATQGKEEGERNEIHMSKEDADAFYNRMPIRPDEWWQHVIQWQDVTNDYEEDAEELFYILPVLPFGEKAAVEIAHQVSRAVHFMYLHPQTSVKNSKLTVEELPVIAKDDHTAVVYMDDFLIIAKVKHAEKARKRIRILLRAAGIPRSDDPRKTAEAELEPDKVYVGIKIDSIGLTLSITQDMLERVRKELEAVLGLTVIPKKRLESVIGLLNFCAKCVRYGRTFMRRLRDALRYEGHKKVIWCGPGIKADIRMWQTFVLDWNGVSFIPRTVDPRPEIMMLSTDATPAKFCMVNLLSGEYVHGNFPSWADGLDISSKELITMYGLLIFPWKTALPSKVITLFGDNESAVECFESGVVNAAGFMCVLRKLALYEARHGCRVVTHHVRSEHNVLADAGTRDRWDLFNSHYDTLQENADVELFKTLQERKPDPKFFEVMRQMCDARRKHLQRLDQAQKERASKKSSSD